MRYNCECDSVWNEHSYYGNMFLNEDRSLPLFEGFNELPPELKANIIKEAFRHNLADLGKIELISWEWKNLINTFVWPDLLRERYTEDQIEESRGFIEGLGLKESWGNIYKLLASRKYTAILGPGNIQAWTEDVAIEKGKRFFWYAKDSGTGILPIYLRVYGNYEVIGQPIANFRDIDNKKIESGMLYVSKLYEAKNLPGLILRSYRLGLMCGDIRLPNRDRLVCEGSGGIVVLD